MLIEPFAQGARAPQALHMHTRARRQFTHNCSSGAAHSTDTRALCASPTWRTAFKKQMFRLPFL